MKSQLLSSFVTTITGFREQHPQPLDEMSLTPSREFWATTAVNDSNTPLLRWRQEKMGENQQQLYPKWHMMPAVTCLAFTRLLVCEDCKHSSDKCWGAGDDIGSIWLPEFWEGDDTLSYICRKKSVLESVCVIFLCAGAVHIQKQRTLEDTRIFL